MRILLAFLALACACRAQAPLSPAPASLAPIKCEIRFHFREHLRGPPTGKQLYSAPAFRREPLPKARSAFIYGHQVYLVKGKAPNLPYTFAICVTHAPGQATLQVDILAPSGESLDGYPRTLEEPLSMTGIDEFEVPVSPKIKEDIQSSLLEARQRLTHVALYIGPAS